MQSSQPLGIQAPLLGLSNGLSMHRSLISRHVFHPLTTIKRFPLASRLSLLQLPRLLPSFDDFPYESLNLTEWTSEFDEPTLHTQLEPVDEVDLDQQDFRYQEIGFDVLEAAAPTPDIQQFDHSLAESNFEEIVSSIEPMPTPQKQPAKTRKSNSSQPKKASKKKASTKTKRNAKTALTEAISTQTENDQVPVFRKTETSAITSDTLNLQTTETDEFVNVKSRDFEKNLSSNFVEQNIDTISENTIEQTIVEDLESPNFVDRASEIIPSSDISVQAIQETPSTHLAESTTIGQINQEHFELELQPSVKPTTPDLSETLFSEGLTDNISAIEAQPEVASAQLQRLSTIRTPEVLSEASQTIGLPSEAPLDLPVVNAPTAQEYLTQSEDVQPLLETERLDITIDLNSEFVERSPEPFSDVTQINAPLIERSPEFLIDPTQVDPPQTVDRLLEPLSDVTQIDAPRIKRSLESIIDSTQVDSSIEQSPQLTIDSTQIDAPLTERSLEPLISSDPNESFLEPHSDDDSDTVSELHSDLTPDLELVNSEPSVQATDSTEFDLFSTVEAPIQGYAVGGVVAEVTSPSEIAASDTVPAMLTPGEFVVNARAAQKNLPLLHQLNQGKAIEPLDTSPATEAAIAPQLNSQQPQKISRTPASLLNPLLPQPTSILSGAFEDLSNETTVEHQSDRTYSSPNFIFRSKAPASAASPISSPTQWDSIEALLTFSALEDGISSSTSTPFTPAANSVTPIVQRRTVQGFAGGGEVMPLVEQSEPSPTAIATNAMTTSSPDGKTPSTTDIETLAHEIYQRLRQRLEIERERCGLYSGRMPW